VAHQAVPKRLAVHSRCAGVRLSSRCLGRPVGSTNPLIPITIVRKRRACCLEALMRFHFPAPLRRRIEFSHRGLHRNSEGERTVKTACLNSDLTLVFTTVRQVRTGTRGTHRGQKNNLPSKAEYVDANCSSRPQSPLAFMGGPYTVSLNPVHLDENRLIGYVLFSMLDSN